MMNSYYTATTLNNLRSQIHSILKLVVSVRLSAERGCSMIAFHRLYCAFFPPSRSGFTWHMAFICKHTQMIDKVYNSENNERTKSQSGMISVV